MLLLMMMTMMLSEQVVSVFFLPKWRCEMNGCVLVYDDVFADGTKNNASVFKTKASSHV